MAKKAMIERNKKRERMVAQYAAKRAELKRILSDPGTSDDEFYVAQRKLTKLPKNSNPIRLRNRCSVTGRPRAYLRKYGVSRITFRELATQGKIPGVTKSSW
ncbi:30S ribosomal protein S14 [Puniceicoccales bacterium CK1056]|uniref:Small ribosomal subunit protein uS14 n=1 Tax=Oceanipulchritudo coccoides TaxID=2706888 RepID=A0A6B2M2P5_9BACT|nr:30S ribosomal protein S14 [Oceanipulchritudo coccoides]NDV62656.1 30S ribosomal protein S14 [Oceanipulchritudo coccoides]